MTFGRFFVGSSRKSTGSFVTRVVLGPDLWCTGLNPAKINCSRQKGSRTTSPSSHHRYVAGETPIPKNEVARIDLAIPVGVQGPQESLPEDSDMAGACSRPVAHHRNVPRYAAERIDLVDSLFENVIPVAIQNPQESLPEI